MTLKEKLELIGDAMKNDKVIPKKHLEEVYENVMNGEMPMPEPDRDLEERWSKETYGDRDE